MEFKPNTTEYKNQHAKEHYDRINVFFPKGQREKLKQFATEHGMSLNELFKEAVKQYIESR